MLTRTDLYGEVRTFPDDIWVDLDEIMEEGTKMDMESKFSYQEYTVAVKDGYEVS